MESPSHRAAPHPADDWWWIFDPRFSIRARATLWVAGTGMAFTVLASWLTGAVFERSLGQQAGRHFESLAVQVSDKVDRAIYERFRELQLLANLDAIRQASETRSAGPTVLNALLSVSPDFGWVGLLAADGRVLASTDAALVNADLSDRPWFRGAREKPFAGGVREIPELARMLPPTEFDSTRFLDLAVPVTATNGQFAGVVGAHVRWDWAQEVQLSVVAEPALRERISVTLYSGPDETVLDSQSSNWSQPPAVPAFPEARRFRGAMVESTAAGVNYFSGYARSRGFRDYRGLGWVTLVRQPLDLAFAPVRELRRTIFGWGAAFTLFLATGTWLISGRFVRRLDAYTAAADRMRDGDVLTVLPRSRSTDEFGRMGDALGALVETLRARGDPPPSPPAPSSPSSRPTSGASDSSRRS
jgi:HAMP domain-containing protein